MHNAEKLPCCEFECVALPLIKSLSRHLDISSEQAWSLEAFYAPEVLLDCQVSAVCFHTECTTRSGGKKRLTEKVDVNSATPKQQLGMSEGATVLLQVNTLQIPAALFSHLGELHL